MIQRNIMTPFPSSLSASWARTVCLLSKTHAHLSLVSGGGKNPFKLQVVYLLQAKINDLFRICPGKELADSSLFIAIASSVAVFDIRKARDEKGREIEPVHEYTLGALRCVYIQYTCLER